jgi:hypothetical protein
MVTRKFLDPDAIDEAMEEVAWLIARDGEV